MTHNVLSFSHMKEFQLNLSMWKYSHHYSMTATLVTGNISLRGDDLFFFRTGIRCAHPFLRLKGPTELCDKKYGAHKTKKTLANNKTNIPMKSEEP